MTGLFNGASGLAIGAGLASVLGLYSGCAGLSADSGAAPETGYNIVPVTTDASTTPTTVALTLDPAITGFRVWTGPAVGREDDFTLYVKKNSDAVYEVNLERYQGRIFNGTAGDTFAFGTSDGRTLHFAQMVVPAALPTPSGATGTANCDAALPSLWEPAAAHITLPTAGSSFQIDSDGTERKVFIAEKSPDGTWSPPRWVRHSATRATKVQCNYQEVALANEAGATLTITAPTGSTIGGTNVPMTLAIPAVTGTTHSPSTVSALKTAIAAAVAGDEIVMATGTYALDVAITDASFTANELLGNEGAEGILIRGATGDPADVILTGNGTSTNGNWSLTQTGATDFTSLVGFTFDGGTQAIGITFSGGKLNTQDILLTGGTGTNLFSANNAAGALTHNACRTFCEDGAGDLFNYDGNATYNAASSVSLVGCGGARPGADNSYQCLTTHNDLPIDVEGGLWTDAQLNVWANGNDTSIIYAAFASVTNGARRAGVANTRLYCCDWEVQSQVGATSTVTAAIGTRLTGSKTTATFAVLRNCPIIKHCLIGVTGGRSVHNSIPAMIEGNIITGADTAIRNGDAGSLQASSDINFNTLAGNTTGLNHPTTTNDPAVFSSNAAKTNTTSVNTTAGAKTSLTGDYNVLDPTVDTDYVAGANDIAGADADLDSDYFPTAAGNCDDNGDWSKLGFVGGTDPFGFVFSYKQSAAPRGARSRPIIRSGAELYPDFW